MKPILKMGTAINPRKGGKSKMSKATQYALGGAIIAGAMLLFGGSASAKKKKRSSDDGLPPPPEPEPPEPSPEPEPDSSSRPSPEVRTSRTRYPPVNNAEAIAAINEIAMLAPGMGSKSITKEGDNCFMVSSLYADKLGRHINRKSSQSAAEFLADVAYLRHVSPPAPGYSYSFRDEADNPTADPYVDLWLDLRNSAKAMLKSACGTDNIPLSSSSRL